jgi:hypothetical protein
MASRSYFIKVCIYIYTHNPSLATTRPPPPSTGLRNPLTLNHHSYLFACLGHNKCLKPSSLKCSLAFSRRPQRSTTDRAASLIQDFSATRQDVPSCAPQLLSLEPRVDPSSPIQFNSARPLPRQSSLTLLASAPLPLSCTSARNRTLQQDTHNSNHQTLNGHRDFDFLGATSRRAYLLMKTKKAGVGSEGWQAREMGGPSLLNAS